MCENARLPLVRSQGQDEWSEEEKSSFQVGEEEKKGQERDFEDVETKISRS